MSTPPALANPAHRPALDRPSATAERSVTAEPPFPAR